MLRECVDRITERRGGRKQTRLMQRHQVYLVLLRAMSQQMKCALHRASRRRIRHEMREPEHPHARARGASTPSRW